MLVYGAQTSGHERSAAERHFSALSFVNSSTPEKLLLQLRFVPLCGLEGKLQSPEIVYSFTLPGREGQVLLLPTGANPPP